MNEIFKGNRKAGWLAFLMGAVMLAPAAHAEQSLTLGWNPSTSSTNTVGYHIYYGPSGSGTNFPNMVDAGNNTNYVVSGLQEGQTNFFVVTSYDSSKVDSPPSNEISYITPGVVNVAYQAGSGKAPLITFPVTAGVTYKLQASIDLATWTTIWQSSFGTNIWTKYQDTQGTNMQMRFYRVIW